MKLPLFFIGSHHFITYPAGKIKAHKEKLTEKLDGAMAAIMALDLASSCGNDNGASVYDDSGLLLI